jgi:hypothetical protein
VCGGYGMPSAWLLMTRCRARVQSLLNQQGRPRRAIHTQCTPQDTQAPVYLPLPFLAASLGASALAYRVHQTTT